MWNMFSFRSLTIHCLLQLDWRRQPFVQLLLRQLHISCISAYHHPSCIYQGPGWYVRGRGQKSPDQSSVCSFGFDETSKGELTFFENSSAINRFRRQESQSKFPAHLSVTTGVDMMVKSNGKGYSLNALSLVVLERPNNTRSITCMYTMDQ